MEGFYIYICRDCRTALERADFFPSDLKRGTRRCRKCTCLRQAAARKKAPAQKIKKRVNASERKKRGVQFKPIAAKQVWATLSKHSHKSVLSGETSELTLVRYFIDLGLDEHLWNAVPVTTTEARKLPRKDQAERSALFAPSLRDYMDAHRKTLELK